MQYAVYLARGWPITSGVIEGACNHVVRGRLDLSGMKWARPGAHAMLQLRTVRLNDYQEGWAKHNARGIGVVEYEGGERVGRLSRKAGLAEWMREKMSLNGQGTAVERAVCFDKWDQGAT